MAWLEGNVLTHEARNTIQNFFFVAQMRPDFIPDANKNDEDIFSDEDIALVCQQANVSEEKAKDALVEAEGDLARAILILTTN